MSKKKIYVKDLIDWIDTHSYDTMASESVKMLIVNELKKAIEELAIK